MIVVGRLEYIPWALRNLGSAIAGELEEVKRMCVDHTLRSPDVGTAQAELGRLISALEARLRVLAPGASSMKRTRKELLSS